MPMAMPLNQKNRFLVRSVMEQMTRPISRKTSPPEQVQEAAAPANQVDPLTAGSISGMIRCERELLANQPSREKAPS